jgi:DNA polymerase-1
MVGAGGRPINAIVGFFGILMRVYREETPRGIFVGWDTYPYETYRNELWPDYQTGRVFDDAIREQLKVLPELCKLCGIGVGAQTGFEADDMCASATSVEVAQGGGCLLLTTDKDYYQLVSDQVTVLSPVRGTPVLERIGPMQVVEKFGVLPQQVPDFKALSGDSSDKIPGIRGIGPKAASALLLKHGTLERAVESWTNQAEIDLALKFKRVTTMQSSGHVDLPIAPPAWANAASALRDLGADNLAERMTQIAEATI